MIKRGWVIKNIRNLYLMKVVLPVTKVRGEQCLWTNDVRFATNWGDYEFACALGDLWNITKSGYCTPVQVEIAEDGTVICEDLTPTNAELRELVVNKYKNLN